MLTLCKATLTNDYTTKVLNPYNTHNDLVGPKVTDVDRYVLFEATDQADGKFSIKYYPYLNKMDYFQK